MNEDRLIEQLADLEHDRWSRWMRHQFNHWTQQNIDRWKDLMDIPYAELSESLKESDRKEARKTMEIVGPVLLALEAEVKRLRAAINGEACSICGGEPSVNVDGACWLCGPCVFKCIEDLKEE